MAWPRLVRVRVARLRFPYHRRITSPEISNPKAHVAQLVAENSRCAGEAEVERLRREHESQQARKQSIDSEEEIHLVITWSRIAMTA